NPPKYSVAVNSEHLIERASTTEGLPVSPSLGPALDAAAVPAQSSLVDRRVVLISALSIFIAIAAACIAQVLIHLIWLITNIAFRGHFSVQYGTPPQMRADMRWWMIFVPIIGGIIVGFMARYGHKAIRGNGIPGAWSRLRRTKTGFRPGTPFSRP